jgi:hypothetical protein
MLLKKTSPGLKVASFFTALALFMALMISSGFCVQEPADSEFEIAVSQAILATKIRSDLVDAYRTEAHTILDIVENDNNITVYAMVYSAAFTFREGKLRLQSGYHGPRAISFERDNGDAYNLIEYWRPWDGDYYSSSIEAKFPRSLWEKTDTQLYIAEHSMTALRNAQDYYDVTDYTVPEIFVLKPLEIEKASKPNWEDYFKIIDDTDGPIDLSEAYIWDVMIDFSKSGRYPLHVIVSDNAGNENRSLSYEVTVK